MRIRHFVDQGLGNSAYLLISETDHSAALIDPLRDVDQYVNVACQEGARITHVFETHVHNDFLSGSRELAAATGARIVASAAAGLEFDHQPVRDCDVVALGEVRLSVLATPGHTPEHVSYLSRDTSRPGDPPVLFSGGSLLVGAVSRTDLLGHEHATGLAHELYRSLHERILPLGDDVVVYPTHGAGSFCTAAASAESTTTIGRERRTNLFLQEPDPAAFAQRLHSSMPSYPTYFLRMRALNQRGPQVLGGVPRLAPLTPLDVRARQQRGQAVVDMRSIHDYARGHIPRAFHVELRAAFGSWIGWVVPFGVPIILLSETKLVHEYAVRQLIRIGYDELPGYLDGGMDAWTNAGLPVATTAKLTMRELRERLGRGEPLFVVDVRQAHEWQNGHLPHAVLREAGDLPKGFSELPHGRTIAAHCGHGERAATAVSLLEQRGYTDLALVTGGLDEWRAAGGEVERGDVPPAQTARTA
jgi:hydroxyacylglutathione hydrolase